ncbi:hypothetical protein K438DRAFT_1943877 [Mycena galopus ATCC 62051]|nr:hypothetical protein K438DRAFT_1943877 [Mycena galopus ATCC 62051]
MDVGRIGRSPESRRLFLLPMVITSVFSYASEGFVLCVARAKGTYRNKPEKATNLEEVGEGLARAVEVGLRGNPGTSYMGIYGVTKSFANVHNHCGLRKMRQSYIGIYENILYGRGIQGHVAQAKGNQISIQNPADNDRRGGEGEGEGEGEEPKSRQSRRAGYDSLGFLTEHIDHRTDLDDTQQSLRFRTTILIAATTKVLRFSDKTSFAGIGGTEGAGLGVGRTSDLQARRPDYSCCVPAPERLRRGNCIWDLADEGSRLRRLGEGVTEPEGTRMRV